MPERTAGWATGYAAGQLAERNRIRQLADEHEVEYLVTDPLSLTGGWHPFSKLVEQTAPEGDPS